MRFISPNGSRIIGTLERLTARANATEFSETGEPDYEGGTEVFWDDQETVTVCRRIGDTLSIVYLDEHGAEWTFDQLSPEPGQEAAE
jgi:hypothetical protein